MRGLAADDAAERDEPVELAVRLGGHADRAGNLERARHLHGLEGRAGRGQRPLGAFAQQRRDMRVVRRLDEQQMRLALRPSRALPVPAAAAAT